jgi:glycosyltransferase involved in cell wall biosynthesis
VATAVNAVANGVIPGETGLLVPPARPRLLAEALRYLRDSPPAAARMATAAGARIGTRLTEATLGDALRAAYATGLAPTTVSSANWPSPTLG